MTAPAFRSRLFRRLETDPEFRARLLTLRRKVYDMTSAAFVHGELLDNWADEHYQVQRRILEVEA